MDDSGIDAIIEKLRMDERERRHEATHVRSANALDRIASALERIADNVGSMTTASLQTVDILMSVADTIDEINDNMA